MAECWHVGGANMTQSAPAPPEARADRNAEAANSEGPAIGRSKQPDAVKEHYFGPRLQAEFCFAPGFRPLNHGGPSPPPFIPSTQ